MSRPDLPLGRVYVLLPVSVLHILQLNKAFVVTQDGLKPTEPPAVDRIIVSQSAYDSEDPGRLSDQVIGFVHAMLGECCYEREELPTTALYFYSVLKYAMEVYNGGHGQFVGNSRWEQAVVEEVREGLKAMAAEPFVEIFCDLCRLIESDPERAAAIAAAGGFGEPDPAIEELNDRFFAAGPGATTTDRIMTTGVKWLRGLAELSVVPDDDYERQLDAVCKANPLRSERRVRKHQELLQGKLTNDFYVAMRLLCMEAKCLPVLGLGAGHPGATAPDGTKTTAWTVISRTGEQTLYFSNDTAFLCDVHLADGRRLTNELHVALRHRAAAGDAEAISLLSNKSDREVARVAATEIGEAVDAAKQLPVLIAAEMFRHRREGEGMLKDVHAAKKTGSGAWLWVVVTETQTYAMAFAEENWVLLDNQLSPLDTLSKADVERAVS